MGLRAQPKPFCGKANNAGVKVKITLAAGGNPPRFFFFFFPFVGIFYNFFLQNVKARNVDVCGPRIRMTGEMPREFVKPSSIEVFTFLRQPGATKSLLAGFSLFLYFFFLACGGSRLPYRYFDAKCWVAAPSRIHGNTRKVSGADKAHTTKVNDCCPGGAGPGSWTRNCILLKFNNDFYKNLCCLYSYM